MWLLSGRHQLQVFENKQHGNVSGSGPKYMGHSGYYIMRNFSIFTEQQASLSLVRCPHGGNLPSKSANWKAQLFTFETNES
jgi:hypothetical protein